MALDVVDEPLLIFGHAEEVVGLLESRDLSAAVGTLAFHKIFFGEVAFTAHAVPAGVFGLVDLAPVVKILEDLFHHILVAGFGGADEVIVGDPQLLPELLKTHHRFVGVLLGCDTVFGGGIFHLLAVFVGTGEEVGIVTHGPVETGKHIGKDRGISMTDMRTVIDVINGSGHIKFSAHSFCLLSKNTFYY